MTEYFLSWEEASDEQILSEIDRLVAMGYKHLVVGENVSALLQARGLLDQVAAKINVGSK